MWWCLAIAVSVTGAVICTCPRTKRRYIYYKAKDLVKAYFNSLEGTDTNKKIKPLKLNLD